MTPFAKAVIQAYQRVDAQVIYDLAGFVERMPLADRGGAALVFARIVRLSSPLYEAQASATEERAKRPRRPTL